MGSAITIWAFNVMLTSFLSGIIGESLEYDKKNQELYGKDDYNTPHKIMPILHNIARVGLGISLAVLAFLILCAIFV